MKMINSLLAILIIISAACTNDPDENTTGNSSYRLIKGINDSAAVTLKYGEETVVNENIKIKFNGVNEDSRCPMDAICIWQGNAAAEIEITTPDEKITEVLNSTVLPQSVWVSGITIELKQVNPYPSTLTKIEPKDYSVVLNLKLDDVAPASDYVKLIDGDDLSIIKKDPLQFNKASVDGDKLLLNLSYSGGCRTHEIELFALKSIEKTNPARVTVLISHNSKDDLCEAYITKDYKFDLSALKDYAINHYNITDKVVLVIYDPEGDQTGETLEYQFPQ